LTGGVASFGTIQLSTAGQGDQLVVVLGSLFPFDVPLCTLPFVISGSTATLVPGSTCTTPIGVCSPPMVPGPDLTPATRIMTFYGGSAVLQGDTLTLQLSDVDVFPQLTGSVCVPELGGLNQVDIESFTATLLRVPSGQLGVCDEPYGDAGCSPGLCFYEQLAKCSGMPGPFGQLFPEELLLSDAGTICDTCEPSDGPALSAASMSCSDLENLVLHGSSAVSGRCYATLAALMDGG
jgi:hypothetical protein